ncbi:C2 domain [Musa troglodytarum]|uniref:C2 domain n=1 Tax=Musa troglodytarum TaxID=320322 RepID=A0A9E7GCC4_9LILI|nr:C2 domain [Musa troglodytarum]URE12689.1 C2 domain [Musa troglodytarum]
MDSYQLFSATSDSPTTAAEPGKSKSAAVVRDSTTFDGEFDPQVFIGFLEVFIYQARDIHNICIYHKQDVYAKLCLTSDPDVAVSTRIINGGGRNPVFNENLRLSVRTIESSLKCEIWMLSRVKNYLEDQLLGFALVPLSDVLLAKAKLVQEFSLSSTDLFHSPAGFVQLSLSYVGGSPDVMAITAVPKTVIAVANLPDAETEDSIPCEYEKIEFPDLKVANENQQMVSEYFGLQSTDMETQSSESLVTSESGNCVDDDAGVRLVESFSSAKRLGSLDSDTALKNDTTISSVSMAESSPVTLPVASQSISDMLSVTASPSRKDKSSEVTDGEADSSEPSKVEFMRPIISINIEPEQRVVQQDIVDMYMKSMQEFTESLAKMKLPMDMETSSSPSVENGSPDSERKVTTPKGIGSKVFYGSRAFF